MYNIAIILAYMIVQLFGRAAAQVTAMPSMTTIVTADLTDFHNMSATSIGTENSQFLSDDVNWSFTVYTVKHCAKSPTLTISGPDRTDCQNLKTSNNAYSGLKNHFVAPDKVVYFYRASDCSGNLIFTLNNHTDPRGCFTPKVPTILWPTGPAIILSVRLVRQMMSSGWIWAKTMGKWNS